MLRSKQGYKVEILCIRYDINSMRNLKYVLCTVMVVFKKNKKTSGFHPLQTPIIMSILSY